MKKVFKNLLCMIICASTALSITSCVLQTTPPKPDGSETSPSSDERIYILKDGKTDFTIVYSDDGVEHYSYAKDVFTRLYIDNMVDVERYEYDDPAYEERKNEILIGATDRQVSKDLVAEVDAISNNGKDIAWGYGYKDGKLAYYANSEEAFKLSWSTFFNLVFKPDSAEVSSDLWVVDMKNREEYEYESTYKRGAEYYTANILDIDNGTIIAEASHADTGSVVTLKGEGYSIARMISNVGMIQPNYFYDIQVDIKNSNPKTDIDILEIWYTASGKEIVRQYVNKDRLSLSPANAERLEVCLLVRGENADTVNISLPDVRAVRAYESRNVRLAAVTLSYGNVNGRARTMQDNVDQSIQKIDALCQNAAFKPDLILLTENFNAAGVSFSNIHNSFISIESSYIKQLQDKAKEHKVYLSFSFKELGSDGYYYNTAPLIDRNGEIIAVHRKCHLTMKELAYGIIPGNEITVCDTDFGKVGIAICWDLFFNDYVDILAKKNVDLIINPSYGYWDDINSMRAEDAGAYIISAGQSASGTAIVAPEGNSNINAVADYGNIICKGNDSGANGIAAATVDLNKRYYVKYLSAPSAAERDNVYENESRPDLYEKYK